MKYRYVTSAKQVLGNLLHGTLPHSLTRFKIMVYAAPAFIKGLCRSTMNGIGICKRYDSLFSIFIKKPLFYFTSIDCKIVCKGRTLWNFSWEGQKIYQIFSSTHTWTCLCSTSDNSWSSSITLVTFSTFASTSGNAVRSCHRLTYLKFQGLVSLHFDTRCSVTIYLRIPWHTCQPGVHHHC